MTEKKERLPDEKEAREKQPYEAPRVESVHLTEEAAEALT